MKRIDADQILLTLPVLGKGGQLHRLKQPSLFAWFLRHLLLKQCLSAGVPPILSRYLWPRSSRPQVIASQNAVFRVRHLAVSWLGQSHPVGGTNRLTFCGKRSLIASP